jgi:hypothetical protein
VFFAFLVTASAQEAEKLDSFGEVPCEELRGRLDNFLVHLRNEPSAKGFVIVYEGKYSRPVYKRNQQPEYKDFLPAVGEAKYRRQVMASHFRYRKFSVDGTSIADRISIVDGGFRENFTAEFWIVPSGTEPPKPTPTLDKIKYRKGKPAKIVCET